MRLNILVKPRAKHTRIISEGSPLTIAIRAPPEHHAANKELINYLTKHYQKPVRIVSGFNSRHKIVEIAG